MRPLPHDAARPARLRVGVVGAGRVGAVLGAALARAGHAVVAVSAVSDASRGRAGALLPGVPVRPVEDVVASADLVLLTVPDAALPALVEGLARTGALRRGTLVAHTSGRHGLAALHPVVEVGGLPLALHPALVLAGTRIDLERLTGTSFGVTAPEPLLPVAQALVVEMGGEPVVLAEQQRPLWSAALAHGAGHLSTLVASVADLLRTAGVEEPAQVLAPLLSAALDGSLRQGDAALVGAGNAGTVAAHLDVLAARAPEVLPSYIALARLQADRALASGRLDPDRAGALLEALASSRDGSARR
jgi:predicted short-subunit dehydrogenase-like oxidoreductase (DUF2520 family)